jgi:hypothetical protein
VADDGINRYETFLSSVLVTMRLLTILELEVHDKEERTLLSDIFGGDLHIDIPVSAYYNSMTQY